MVFMEPIKVDIDNLSCILRLFGNITDLHTNFLKSFVVPIRCGNVNLPHVLQSLLAAQAFFPPIKYSGLPLSVSQLKQVDFQFLEDKAASKLITWDGQNITAIGKALIKSVLSSQVVYFMTPLIVPPSTLRISTSSKELFFARVQTWQPVPSARLTGT